jgi:hypothetical protein
MIHPWLTVLTTPARPEYLLGTLASIHAAGGHRFVGNRVVFVDGDVNAAPAVPGGWVKLTAGGGPRGSRRAMWKILNMAAVARAPYLLYFEDDVRLCVNAIAAMSAAVVPRGIAFLTFLNQHEGVSARTGIHCRRADDPTVGHGYWGSQALKIPLRSLRPFERRHTEPKNQWAYAADEWLGQQLATAGSAEHHYGIVQPSLVRHIGARTTIPSQQGQTLDGHRSGLGYPGDDFDATANLPANLPVFGL